MFHFQLKPFFGKIGNGKCKKKRKGKSFFTWQIAASFVVGFLAAAVFFGAADAGTFAVVTGSGDVLSASMLNSASAAETSTLKLSKNKKHAGSVSGDNDFECSSEKTSCKHSYTRNSIVAVTAYPEAGYKVKKWKGCDISWSEDSCKLTMDKSKKSVKVYFEKDENYSSFTLSKSYKNGGSVTAEDYGFSCSSGESRCVQAFQKNLSVAFLAAPADGYEFNKWKGCDSVSDSICYVTMDKSKESAKVYFKKTSSAGSTGSSGTKKLTLYTYAKKIDSSSGGIASVKMSDTYTCTAIASKTNKCTITYERGASAVIKAEPQSGYELEKWKGCDSYSGNECTVSMDKNKFVRAYFKESEGEKYVLKIESKGEGNAYGYLSVKADGASKLCWSDNTPLSSSSSSSSSVSPCEYKYSPGTEIELSYYSYGDTESVSISSFKDSDDLSAAKENKRVITLNEDRTMTVNFNSRAQHTLKIEAIGDKAGKDNVGYGYVAVESSGRKTETCWSDNVTSNTGDISPCEYAFADGEEVTLKYKLKGTKSNAGGVAIYGLETGELVKAGEHLIKMEKDRTIQYDFSSGIENAFIGFVEINSRERFENNSASADEINISGTPTSDNRVRIVWNAFNVASCDFEKTKGAEQDAVGQSVIDNKSGDYDELSGSIETEVTDIDVDEESKYKITCESDTGKDSAIANIEISVE